MEILYVYIDNYKNIKDSEYLFYEVGIKYNREKNAIELNNTTEEICEKVDKKAMFFSKSKKNKKYYCNNRKQWFWKDDSFILYWKNFFL